MLFHNAIVYTRQHRDRGVATLHVIDQPLPAVERHVVPFQQPGFADWRSRSPPAHIRSHPCDLYCRSCTFAALECIVHLEKNIYEETPQIGVEARLSLSSLVAPCVVTHTSLHQRMQPDNP